MSKRDVKAGKFSAEALFPAREMPVPEADRVSVQ
jgi:hypothetical protein